MTREELLKASGLDNSGNITAKLEELESCGFIRKYNAYGMKKKNAVYQLVDFFTLFYYQFMESGSTDPRFWTNQINTPRLNTWSGLSFERVAMYHVDEIKSALGISGVYTEVNSWYCAPDEDKGVFGSQIDLLIVRRDQIINLCEMKYSDTEYTITKAVNEDMNKKVSDLIKVTKTKYAIHPTLVTCYGLVNNRYSDPVQAVITMDDLFSGK